MKANIGEILRMYMDKVPVQEIGEKLGISAGCVYYHLKKQGIAVRTAKKKKHRHLSNDDIRKLLAEGTSPSIIARTHGGNFYRIKELQRECDYKPSLLSRIWSFFSCERSKR